MSDNFPNLIHPFAPTTRNHYLEIVRGEGATVYDRDGRGYVDALASLWYCNVGHGRSDIAELMGEQARKLAGYHIFDKFTNPMADGLAETLASMSPIEAVRVFLTDGGSEAIDTAMKLAYLSQRQRGHSHKTLFVSMTNSYHGMAYGGSSIAGIEANRRELDPLLPDTIRVPRNDIEAIEEVFSAMGDQISAIFIEPVSGSGGVIPANSEYMETLRTLCNRAGAYLVFDEVITGFGRLGHWFAASTSSVTPDMITFAKGIASGYIPLGGVLVGPSVREPLETDNYVLRHGYTYSGHPVACAVGSAVINIIDRENLFAGAHLISDVLETGLNDIKDRGLIQEVRGRDGIWAAKLHDGTSNTEVRDHMLDHGVIARPVCDNTIAFCPPLMISKQQLNHCLDALDAATKKTTQ